VQAAAIQMEPVLGDVAENLRRAELRGAGDLPCGFDLE
jgi:hypothetical protein